MIRKTPLQRSTTPIRKISKKRVNLNKVYRALSKTFLEEHPFCQHWIAECGLDEAEVIRSGGWYQVELNHPLKPYGLKSYVGKAQVPRSAEIHHKKGRGKYFLDPSTFMAVRPNHAMYIHMFTKEAYERGYMLPRN
jgi:hypothetical protein